MLFRSIAHRLIMLVACLFVLLTLPACASSPVPPNVILIISDDAGYVDFGYQGSAEVPTPNIDSIARNGVRFTQGYVSASVCSPSRAGLITGRYQQRFGHEGNLSDPNLGLPLSEKTFADHFKARGYDTIAIGKWHLGNRPVYHPQRRGFDHFYGLIAGSRGYFALDDPGRLRVLQHNGQAVEDRVTYLTDDLGDYAARYIRAERPGDNPFLMYLAFTAPHTPMHATEQDLARFDSIEDGKRRTYVAMTAALDRAVGNVLQALRETGQLQDTLVVFVNDNGGATNNGSDNGPLRGMKGSVWEGGVRVPFMMQWPAGMAGGETYDQPVISLDLLPTALAAAGADTLPENLDGVDLLPFIRGQDRGQPHETLFWRRFVAASVREGRWKLVRSDSNPTVLIDLIADPAETTDVAAQHPGVVRSLLGKLAAWESELAEPLWREGERWERNQIYKHRMDVIGRDAERRFP